MPTAALIDLNHIALKHLDKAFYYLQLKEYDSCTASIHAVNASLPPEYHIIFDTEKYSGLIEHPMEIYCKSCGVNFKRDSIKTWDMLLPLFEQVISKTKTVKAWSCPDCNKINILRESKIILTVREEPFFTKVVPMPPEQKQSVGDRTSFHIKYRSWFGMVVAELTRQISQLRWDHWKQGDDNLDLGDLQQVLNTNLEGSF